MDTVRSSQLLEDECMSKLNWSLQRVANSTLEEMKEGLQIFNSLTSKKENVSIKKQTSLSSYNNSTSSSKNQSRRISRQGSPIARKINKPTEIDYTDNHVCNDIIQKTQTKRKNIHRHTKRIHKMKTILESQQTTKKDNEFLTLELTKENRILDQLYTSSEYDLEVISKHIESKRILLSMYKEMIDMKDMSEDDIQKDQNMITHIQGTLKQLESAKEQISIL